MSESQDLQDELPNYLRSGERARLIPTCAPNHRERAACSVLLSTLTVVEPFRRAFLNGVGQRSGRWASTAAFTEPVFRHQVEEMTCRPDGLLIHKTSRREWRALIEAKIGPARVNPGQIQRYVDLARANNVDAVISISNEMSPRTTHLPYPRPAHPGGVDIYHWSWAHLTMLAETVLREERDTLDLEQGYLLEEVVRFFDHEASGIVNSASLAPEWQRLVQKVQLDTQIDPRDPELRLAIASWHQQLATVRVRLCRELGMAIRLKLSRQQREDQLARLKEDVGRFVQSKQLAACLEFTGVAAPIEVVADATRRSIVCRIGLAAPEDRQRPSARINWLLRQLPADADPNTYVDLLWERGRRIPVSLTALRNDPGQIQVDGDRVLRGFELFRTSDLGQRFSGVRTFGGELENALMDFYEDIARHLRPRRPSRGGEAAARPAEPAMPRESDDTPPAVSISVTHKVRQDTVVVKAEAPVQPQPQPQPTARTRKETSAAPTPQAAVPVGTGKVGRAPYRIYGDGSVIIETSKGKRRFNNMVEFKAAIERAREKAAMAKQAQHLGEQAPPRGYALN